MPKLTDEEIQEINRYLAEGKPLPDKYRFLLFGDKRDVELVWNGKTNNVCNIVLPFQTIEQIDEPRTEVNETRDLFSVDCRGRQQDGWSNKLIWGDNKLILSSLKNGPMRDEIEKQGGIKLVYIDPPFDVGADFTMNIEIGDETFTKDPSILEEIAYRDTWGKGTDSFINMIYERLVLMRDLLADDGSIYIHCDWRVCGYIRLILDDIFGRHLFLNEIIWCYKERERVLNFYNPKHDTIFFYAKSDSCKRTFNWRNATTEYSNITKSKFKYDDNDGKGPYQIRGRNQQGSPVQAADGLRPEHEIKYPGLTFRDYLIDRNGVAPRDWWEIPIINKSSDERLYYPTQKPIILINQIISVSSNEGDIVADFFCGSGTTAAAAEKLGRKWIATDLGKFAIHTTRKRLLGVQRELKKTKKPYRSFEVLNLGKYERQQYVSVNQELREEERIKQQEAKEAAFLELILKAYQAESIDNSSVFHGKRSNRLVVVGPLNLPVTRLFVEEIILECRKKLFTKVDILGFEYEMGLFPNILEEAKSKGIDLAPKYIPRDVFDKRAVEKGEISFHDVTYIAARPHFKGKSIVIELTNYSIFYSQDSIANAENALQSKGNTKIVIDNGRIIKISKNPKGIFSREVLTKKWSDWVDYWAVDFDFQNKKEIIRVKNPDTGEIEEKWTGDFIFENEWQTFRTKKDRSLELKSISHEYTCKGRKKIAIKVVDILGNDTMTIIDVNVA